MTSPLPDSLLDEVHDLTLACLSGEASPETIAALDQLVCSSNAACRVYVRTVLDGFNLRRWTADAESFMDLQAGGNSDTALLPLDLANSGIDANLDFDQPSDADRRRPSASSFSRGIVFASEAGNPVSGSLSATHHGAFAYLSSGWADGVSDCDTNNRGGASHIRPHVHFTFRAGYADPSGKRCSAFCERCRPKGFSHRKSHRLGGLHLGGESSVVSGRWS